MHGLGDVRNARGVYNTSIYLKEGDILDFEFECNGQGIYSNAWFRIYTMFE